MDYGTALTAIDPVYRQKFKRHHHEAVAWYSDLIDLGAKPFDSLEARMLCYMALGMADQAAEDASQRIKNGPNRWTDPYASDCASEWTLAWAQLKKGSPEADLAVL